MIEFLRTELRLWCKRRYGSYHRWHKLYIQYCIYTVGEVDVFSIAYILSVRWMSMPFGRRSSGWRCLTARECWQASLRIP